MVRSTQMKRNVCFQIWHQNSKKVCVEKNIIVQIFNKTSDESFCLAESVANLSQFKLQSSQLCATTTTLLNGHNHIQACIESLTRIPSYLYSYAVAYLERDALNDILFSRKNPLWIFRQKIWIIIYYIMMQILN